MVELSRGYGVPVELASGVWSDTETTTEADVGADLGVGWVGRVEEGMTQTTRSTSKD